jgi:DNA invertase Pin-like site-specific DNA recombinase
MPDVASDNGTPLLRAAQYLRMSTDHQRYSIANQSAAIGVYAAAKSMVIVRSYVDAGKSGLHIKGREALQELIATVESGKADFRYILVYDVSRWGRFQDTDEPAHYEFLCKRAGIQVIYCAEQFHHENATINNLLKALKRTMAGEYSRELSVKVFAAQSRIARMGFHVGGPPPYGYRRLLVNADGKPKHLLQSGEHKSNPSDHVVVVLGPENEVQNVRFIFEQFTAGRTQARIGHQLNRQGQLGPGGRPWMYWHIYQILRNRKYTGTYLWAKRTQVMGTKSSLNPQEHWILKEGAIPQIISPRQYAAAQSLLNKKPAQVSEKEMLDHLRRVWRLRGKLCSQVLDQAKPLMGSYYYRRMFGSLQKAYDLIGYKGTHNYTAIAAHKSRMKEHRLAFARQVQQQCLRLGATAVMDRESRLLRINNMLTLKTDIAPFLRCPSQRLPDGWWFDILFEGEVDMLVIGRLAMENDRIESYYLIPKLAGFGGRFCAVQNTELIFLEPYRSRDLVPLLEAILAYDLAESLVLARRSDAHQGRQSAQLS